ncbi:MAG: hypothetical protein O7I93_11240 [Gemmatimonadetes bacterium]|nr:hypothetical protein [Gemmatimonadota bacterium]
MDFGELILIIFIVSGILSTLGKKKKPQGKKLPQARPRPRQAQLPSQRRVESAGGAGPTPSRAGMGAPEPRAPSPPARESATATMEDILRQLGLDVGPQPEVELERVPEPEPELLPQVREVEPVEREIPPVLSLEDESIDAVADRAGPEHREFHEEFVKEFRYTDVFRARSRARIHLNPRSLREAVILKEIFGPPKGMQ